ncbi:MAG TPA: trypsin-like peptidase domain-containing protein [Candidatus Saccharimonadales bacterium]|nr:trypsin-like peptidase domain-containing protein [Candidatus Saccharimonadales bacterium]
MVDPNDETKPILIGSNKKPSGNISFKLPGWSANRFNLKGLLKQPILILAVAVLLGFGSGFGGGLLATKYGDQTGLNSGSLSHQKKLVASESELIANIAKTLGPSVVSINVTGEQAVQNFFGFVQPEQTAAAGTGIIISDSGLVVTNRHVVPVGTTSVSVTLADGTELKSVTVLGRTAQSDSLDVAFLKINDLKGHKLTPAVIGDSAGVQVGDAVVAIGNALGQFQNTVTSGIVSGFGRQVQASGGSDQAAENLDNLFQTDAAINEGNSGGPLVNLNGQVIGINTAIAGGAQNIGFAIPINDVKGLINQVLKTGKFERPYLGVRYIPLTPDLSRQYKLSVEYGAFVAPAVDASQPSVVSGSPADKAGLKQGDVITKVDGVDIDQTHSLTTLLNQQSVGDKVALEIVRAGKTLKIEVILGAAPNP